MHARYTSNYYWQPHISSLLKFVWFTVQFNCVNLSFQRHIISHLFPSIRCTCTLDSLFSAFRNTEPFNITIFKCLWTRLESMTPQHETIVSMLNIFWLQPFNPMWKCDQTENCVQAHIHAVILERIQFTTNSNDCSTIR